MQTFDDWVYDAGDLIEQGSVILGGTDDLQTTGFGLRQQYFHKCVFSLIIMSLDARMVHAGFSFVLECSFVNN